MGVWPERMPVHYMYTVPTVYTVPREAQRGCEIPWD